MYVYLCAATHNHFPTPSPDTKLHKQDRVCEVRTAATAALHHLAQVTSPQFVETALLPRVLSLYENAGFYLVRVAVLQALKVR